MGPRRRCYVPKTKGCFQCSQRRINCDRSKPACRKCLKAEISCSGIGIRYRFAHDRNVGGRPAQQWTSQSRDSIRSAQTDQVNCSSTRDIDIPRAIPDALHALERDLLDYFSERIAPVLVTVDDAHNSWRCLLLPVAHASDLVRRAVISAAAGHAPAVTSNTKISTSYAYQQVIHELRQRQDLEGESLLGKQHIVLALLVLLAKAIVDGSQDFRSVFYLLEALLRTVKDRKMFHYGEIGTFILAQVSKFRGYAAPFLSRGEAITILSTCTVGGPPVNANWYEYNTSRNLYPSLRDCMSTIYEVDRRACDIYLARELLGPHTPALIEMVDDFKNTLAAVPAASPGEHTLVWAVFIVALESGVYEHREVFIQFLRRHQQVRGFGSIGKAIEYIESIWAAHEQNDWVEQIMQLPLLVV